MVMLVAFGMGALTENRHAIEPAAAFGAGAACGFSMTGYLLLSEDIFIFTLAKDSSEIVHQECNVTRRC